MLCGGTGSAVFIANNYFIGRVSDIVQIVFTSIFLSIAVILVVVGIKCENALTKKLGQISFEIYVFQRVFFKLLKHWEVNNPVWVLLIIVCGTIGLSNVFQPIFKRIKDGLVKKLIETE